MSEHLARRQQAYLACRSSPATEAVMERVREGYLALVTLLDGAIPESREKSLACTALEDSALWAMHALALSDPGME